MLGRFRSIAAAILTSSIAQSILISAASGPREQPLLTDPWQPAKQKQSTCCIHECKRILSAFERGSQDDFRFLQGISSRVPCDASCQLAQSLMEIKGKENSWDARFPALLPGPQRADVEKCYSLLEGKQISGNVVVFEVLVDPEGNPVTVSRLRGISDEQFNTCVQAWLLASCYRPAFRGRKFIAAKATIGINIYIK